jgi:hypothetical protein
VSPEHFTFPHVADPGPASPNWGTTSFRTISVSLTSDVLVGTGATPDVFAVAGPNLELKCPGQFTFEKSCTFNLGMLTAVPSSTTYATLSNAITVQPTATGTNEPPVTRWEVRIGANGAADSPQVVGLANAPMATATFAPLPGEWQPGAVPLDFKGAGELQFKTPTGTRVTVPVAGRGDANWGLVLFDATKMLSESGKLALLDPRSRGVSSETGAANDWLSFNSTAHVNMLPGLLLSYLTDANTQLHVRSDNVIDGVEATFKLHFRTNDKLPGDDTETVPIDVRVRLRTAVSSGTFCTAASECATGQICDLKFCSVDAAATSIDQGTSTPILGRTASRADAGYVQGSNWATFTTDPWNVFCPGTTQAALLPYSGDMVCGSSTAPLVAPLLVHRDLEEKGAASKKSASELLASCLSELNAHDSADHRTVGSIEFPPTSDYTAAADCVSLGRWSAVATDDSTFPEVAYRAFQQWLEVHSFVAREGLEENEVEAVLAGAAPVTSMPGAGAPSLDQLLSQMEMGWDWLFARLWRLRFPEMPYPDYRYHVNGASCHGNTSCLRALECQNDGNCGRGRYCEKTTAPWAATSGGTTVGVCLPLPLNKAPDYEQGIGLPVHLLQAMTGHLQVAAKLTRTAAIEAYSQQVPTAVRARAVAQAGRTMRFALLVESMAATMKKGLVDEHLCATCDTPAAAIRWDTAVNEFTVARDRLFAEVTSFANGGNPLGFRDDDLPLFFGDPVGTNSRYFAASDYLLDGWAAPAVSTASASLGAARDAWSARQHDVVQNLEASANRERIVDQIKTMYGERIIQNCGPMKRNDGTLLASNEVVEYTNENSTDLATCFIDPTCVGTDDITNKDVRARIMDAEFNKAIATSELCKLDYVFKALANDLDIGPNGELLREGQPYYRKYRSRPPIPPQFLEYWDFGEAPIKDLSCFLGSGYYMEPICISGDHACFTGSSLDSSITNPCADPAYHGDPANGGGHPNCFTVCNKRACHAYPAGGMDDPSSVGECNHCLGLPTETPKCQKYRCDAFNRQGCSDLSCEYFPSTPPTPQGVGTQLIAPDWQFEDHPWSRINVYKADDGIWYIESTQERHKHEARCRIPADYLYGIVPKSWWGFTPMSDISPELWSSATVQCSSGGKLDYIPDPAHPESANYPQLDAPLPMPEMAPTCFSGKMGVTQHMIRGAQLGLQKTRKQIEKLTGDLRELFDNCTAATSDLDRARTAHRSVMGTIASGLQIAGTVASIAFPAAGAAVGAVTVGASLFTKETAQANGEKAGTATAQTLSGIGAALQSRYEQAASDADLQFSQNMALRSCWFEYHTLLRQTGQNVTDIKLALNAIDTQRATLKAMADENNQTRMDGAAKIVAETNRTVASYSHNYWFDEKAERFKTDLEWARRMTYLALEAIEYEFQQSLPFRRDILVAHNPGELEGVVRSLKQEQGARTLNRRRPEESSVVLSLRDDVLGITDRSQETGAGERAWTPAQRIQGRISTPAYAYYGDDGRYLGQAVPFTLGPDGILATRCGERLWRVSATVQGDGLSDGSPNAPLLLLKRNTFASQWCDAEGDQRGGLQSGRIYPSEQLFKPGTNVKLGDANDTTAALLTPWFNVRRTDFYKNTYRDGSSEELAGRGLYGDYVLLFPKELLDRGFPLEKVEDVLLRIDYLSVDNLSK